MKLKELRIQWEKDREELLAISDPNRSNVIVLLQNRSLKANRKNQYSILVYHIIEGVWQMYAPADLYEFEHLGKGVEYINQQMSQYLPQD